MAQQAQQAQQKIVQKDLLLLADCCFDVPVGNGHTELCFVVVPVLKNYFYLFFG
jgi:hypothetical protein